MQGATAQLRDCVISYAGDLSNNSRWRGVALVIETSEPTNVNYCTIHDSARHAVSVAGGAQVDMRWNNIYGNQFGISSSSLAAEAARSDAQVSAPVDARYTWWGHPTGPVHTPTNPDGLGDRVQGNVLFSPWAESPVVMPDLYASLYLPSITK